MPKNKGRKGQLFSDYMFDQGFAKIICLPITTPLCKSHPNFPSHGMTAALVGLHPMGRFLDQKSSLSKHRRQKAGDVVNFKFQIHFVRHFPLASLV